MLRYHCGFAVGNESGACSTDRALTHTCNSTGSCQFVRLLDPLTESNIPMTRKSARVPIHASVMANRAVLMSEELDEEDGLHACAVTDESESVPGANTAHWAFPFGYCLAENGNPSNAAALAETKHWKGTSRVNDETKMH